MQDSPPRPDRLTHITTTVELIEPVLIAPHGDNYHRPKATINIGVAGLYVLAPKCNASAVRWLAVDKPFAELLERGPCPSCDDIKQETISDLEE
jgi:hypothetical protein